MIIHLNPENFSLNKIYKNKNLFNNQNQKLFNAFNENIQKILTSKVINCLYNLINNYEKFENPIIGEKKTNLFNKILI